MEYLGQIPFDKLQSLYNSCSFGVLPSLHEQCSYVALEMAMFGIPMIVSDVDALAEMFKHKETALLTPLIFDHDFGINADKEVFAENIIRMIEDKRLREQLSFKVREHYKEYFTLKRMIDKTVEIYNQLV
jgi:glycosyltransferase involved in cell wall biosynthesis